MLPDIDHHNGSIANSIPPISRWVARIVGAVGGGHLRERTPFWVWRWLSGQCPVQCQPELQRNPLGFTASCRILGRPGIARARRTGWMDRCRRPRVRRLRDFVGFSPWAISVGDHSPDWRPADPAADCLYYCYQTPGGHVP